MHVRSMFVFFPLRRGLSLSLIALLGFIAPAVAEDGDWYQIEVVVFDQAGGPGSDHRQLGLQLGYPDNWRQLTDPDAPPNPWLAEEDGGDAVEPSATETAETPAGAVPEEQPYTLLPSTERRLNGEARSLERSSAYRVLYHQAWRQPLSNRANSAWILIRGGEQYDDHNELEGTLRIYLQRALFAQTRLWQARFRTTTSGGWDTTEEQEAEPLVLPAWPARFGGETPLFERLARESSQRQQSSAWPDLSENGAGENHGKELPISTGLYQVDSLAALEQTQRVELGTTLYLDHPELGVLVHVTRYQRDAAETDESTESVNADSAL